MKLLLMQQPAKGTQHWQPDRQWSGRFDLVVAAGGDGTLNEVVNGLAEQVYRPKLGVIPVGTTNDFARALKIPRNILQATDIIAQGNSVAIDIGRMNNIEYFINIAGGGRLTRTYL